MTKLLSLTALLALAATYPVLAQVPAAATAPQTAGTPPPPPPAPTPEAGPGTTLPAPSVPGYPRGYTDKHLGGSSSGTFPNGVPARDLDNGTGRADQPRANQAQAGAQPTRSIFRGRKRRGQ